MKKKTIVEILLHLVFWIITFYYFVNNSFLRLPPMDSKVEYFSLLLIIGIIYLNYFWMIPRFFSKQKFFNYFLILIPLLFLNTVVEFLMLKDDIVLYAKNVEPQYHTGIFRWNLFGIFFRNALFVGFFTMFRIYRDAIRANKFMDKINSLEKQKMRTEINMVKSKVNSHFFFNTLNSIYALAMVRSEKTADLVMNLSDLMRYVVSDSENEWVALDHEIEFLKNYSELEKKRHQHIEFSFSVQGETNGIKVPPMIFEAYVNNAFKYTDNEGRGYIHIHLECLPDDSLVFSCENNTRSTMDTSISSTNKGLRNTSDRLKLFYDNKHQLETSLENGIYKVRLVLETAVLGN